MSMSLNSNYQATQHAFSFSSKMKLNQDSKPCLSSGKRIAIAYDANRQLPLLVKPGVKSLEVATDYLAEATWLLRDQFIMGGATVLLNRLKNYMTAALAVVKEQPFSISTHAN